MVRLSGLKGLLLETQNVSGKEEQVIDSKGLFTREDLYGSR